MWQFIKDGGPVMFLLLATSFMAVAFMIERGRALLRSRVTPTELLKELEACQELGQLESLQAACMKYDSPLGRLLLTAISHMDWPITENTAAVETKARQEVIQLEKGLVVLEVAVGISPLLGLVGAVHGLIVMFSDFASVADNAGLAQGISIALNTTLVGLLIAIPSLIAWSYYSKKAESLAVEMEALCDAFLRRFYRLGSQE